ncbi:MAG: hypothetical protein WCJ93_01035 [Methanomicrobiales archaeon]
MMVVIITGMITSCLPPSRNMHRLLLIAGLVVNLTWGIIDGVTTLYNGLVNRADYYRIANAFRNDRNDPDKREIIRLSLQGTIVENLPEEEQSGVVDMIGAGKPVSGQKYPATRADWHIAIATILIDFVLVFPVLVPISSSITSGGLYLHLTRLQSYSLMESPCSG